MMVIGGAQRYPNAPIRASPIVITSSFVTPKEAADMPTCSMKYEISEYEMSMNLDLSVVIEIQGEGTYLCTSYMEASPP
jgi:hypothetical protein